MCELRSQFRERLRDVTCHTELRRSLEHQQHSQRERKQWGNHCEGSIGLIKMSSNTRGDTETAVTGQTAQVDCEKLSINSYMAQRVTSQKRFGRDGLRKKAHSVFCWHCSALKERSVLTRCHTLHR